MPVAPVLTVAETMRHPHHRERGTVRTVKDPIAGEFEMPGHPLRFSEFPDPAPLEAPTLGQHNEQVLTEELGHDPDEVRRLESDGVLFSKPT